MARGPLPERLRPRGGTGGDSLRRRQGLWPRIPLSSWAPLGWGAYGSCPELPGLGLWVLVGGGAVPGRASEEVGSGLGGPVGYREG